MTTGMSASLLFQFRQLKPSERNYPVHDKGLLEMLIRADQVSRRFTGRTNFRHMYGSRVAAHSDQEPAPLPAHGELAVVLLGVQLHDSL